MKVLIIGQGGREHALAWKTAQSEQVEKVYVAPGNIGTAQEPKVENIPIKAEDIPALIHFVQQEAIELTIVGPEAPLVAGVVDAFEQAQLRCFGPLRCAAQLEASKVFTKNFLIRHHIPTARFAEFTEIDPALEYIHQHPLPIVIKADGLASGKGVVIAQTEREAVLAVTSMLSGSAFGEAGKRILIEEFLSGEEVSFICMVDGEHILPLVTSQDHKARDDGDKGPNTGGMGAYSPAPIVTPDIHARIMTNIIVPTVRGMALEGNPYKGFLYAGLMIDEQGNPKILEYNCRLGDPETQPILLRLRSDLVDLCMAALDGRLHQIKAEWDSRVALCVVLTAQGYPGEYLKGSVIHGLSAVEKLDGKFFHSGTAREDGKIVTHGGRVLGACALGNTVSEAQAKAYALVNHIHWKGIQYRSDIGYRAIAREQIKEG